MNWILLLYNLLLIAAVLDAASSTLAAAYIFRVRERFGNFWAWAFFGVAFEAWAAALTQGFGPAPQRIVVAALLIRILARLVKTWFMVRLALYLVGYLNGHRFAIAVQGADVRAKEDVASARAEREAEREASDNV